MKNSCLSIPPWALTHTSLLSPPLAHTLKTDIMWPSNHRKLGEKKGKQKRVAGKESGRRPLSRQCPHGLGKLWFLTSHPVEKLPTQEKKVHFTGIPLSGGHIAEGFSQQPLLEEENPTAGTQICKVSHSHTGQHAVAEKENLGFTQIHSTV